jgi:hypothetical protein
MLKNPMNPAFAFVFLGELGVLVVQIAFTFDFC